MKRTNQAKGVRFFQFWMFLGILVAIFLFCLAASKMTTNERIAIFFLIAVGYLSLFAPLASHSRKTPTASPSSKKEDP